MGVKKEHLTARDEYISLVKSELLGPGSEISIPDVEHELITSSPELRYSVGVLYPRDNKLNADNDQVDSVQELTETSEEHDPDNELEQVEHIEDVDSNVTDTDDSPEFMEDENLDEEISLATQNMPSSVGITFLVSSDVKKLKCEVGFATYRKAKIEDCRVPFIPNECVAHTVPKQLSTYIFFDAKESTLRPLVPITRKMVGEMERRDILDTDGQRIIPILYKLSDQLRSGYVRTPHYVVEDIDFSTADYSDDTKNLDQTNAKLTALKRKISSDLYSITVMLVNDAEATGVKGEHCIFQPKIVVRSSNNTFKFKEYSSLLDFDLLNEEDQSIELQYRNKHIYGTGLGTSVNWEIDRNGDGYLCNEYFPEIEVPSVDFSISEDLVPKNALSMRYLSDLDDTPKDVKLEMLTSLVKAYSEWIEKLEDGKTKIPDRYLKAANLNIMGCSKSRDRMMEGIRILNENPLAWDAFHLANRAMFMQRVHLQFQKEMSESEHYSGDQLVSEKLQGIDYYNRTGLTGDNYYWRPFQIAFMLLSIDSICDETSSNRDIVDLIWFPTGGGKTEAYLGLTAFTIFYRRLKYPGESEGTSVIMRYTLRLLAAQQFTRASTLICACEYIRLDSKSKKSKYKKYNLGKQEISIGLWIGRDHTYNTKKVAKEDLSILKGANRSDLEYKKEKHNKFQVLKCPWCGTKMTKDLIGTKMRGDFGYRYTDGHIELFCPQEDCDFNGKLPIQVVDEELYLAPPTLLFGTVDKFAMLPWKEEIGAFFAANTGNRTPDLIIQDELHLISGPLGTMVGLYESVVDYLCMQKQVRPKIIASTATIRRAKQQCVALYNREVCQFPNPGLDVEDSFFARESCLEYDRDSFGRKYVGLMPAGKTKAMMEVRSIAALMQIIHSMELRDSVKDKYWTLTVYFNSLKDLGKCSTLVEDDVKDFIKRIAYRLGTSQDARKITKVDELTSRVKTIRLNETLEKLEKTSYSEDNMDNKRYPSNILLATNMISVGIDIDRLNVMLMVGQPKLTSEYIQASSRVGRTYPGVAFVMYDGSKSRDRSHYEQFKSYHESFYKYVEPTGATPFSKPSRDRALHAAVIAMIRILERELSGEGSAVQFDKEKFADRISDIKRYLVERSSSIIKNTNAKMVDDSNQISNEIDMVFDKWENIVVNCENGKMFYGEKFLVRPPKGDEDRLMKPYNTDNSDYAFDTMTSMRNVDATVCGNILVWEED